MQIKKMFDKPIDRPIKSVIKVGQKDEEDIYQELDEYVVTDELKKHFSKFFGAYSNGITTPTDDIGVWISGFFGSGKSHFLKILSYILNSELYVENAETRQLRRPIDFFRDDHKIEDSLIIADMIKSSDVSTDVILFNIDSKANNAESGKDKILSVFVKVFNEVRGYCTEYPFLADLEKQLDKKGIYGDFKTSFEVINGDNWEDARDDFLFNSDDVVETLVKIGFMSEEAARMWESKAEENYNISIEKFADEVEEYCLSKGNNHHVVFLVDEVGQYIGEDSQLMLNLQSITEDLGSKCNGKAWIIVTSQENIDNLVNVKGDEFDKILGRFKTRLSLSSANVDEVIRKRLLEKNEIAYKSLKAYYPQVEHTLKNKFVFKNSAEMKMYSNADEFASIYPFVPYQFNLLQDCLTSIRDHGAVGENLPKGERSMLELFQKAGIAVMNEDDDVLVPFYEFYNPLHEVLNSSHKSVIIKAGNNDNLDEFDVNVLKVLLLIKYVKELPSNLENISILMIRHIEDDKANIKDRLIQSLGNLERETLIQKNGEEYSFLTNEEQDVNREIKNEIVETGEILSKAANVIFYDIYSEKKFSYNKKYNFAFNKSIDNINMGLQNNDIGLRIISPYYEFITDMSSQATLSEESEDERTYNSLKGLSDKNNEVIVYLGKGSLDVFKEITETIQYEKYLKHHGTEIKKSLRDAKRDELNDKNARVVRELEKSLKRADIFVKGSKLNIVEKNTSERINDAFEDLVTKVYHKLKYMDFSPDQEDVIVTIKEYTQEILAPGESKASNALNDMDNFIKSQSDNFIKPSLKTLFGRFTTAPYGFIEIDVVWLIAKLFSQKRISLILNSEEISLKTNSPDEILKYLSTKDFRDKVLVDKKKETSQKKIKRVKLVLKDAFNEVESSSNDEVVRDRFISESSKKLSEIKDCLTNYKYNAKYPGKNILEDAKNLLNKVLSIKSIDKFYEFVFNHENEFIDMGENTNIVIQFFENQKPLFDEASRSYKIYESNKNFISDEELINLANEIKTILDMPSPYSKIKDLRDLSDDFLEKHKELTDNEKITPRNDIKLEFDEVNAVLNADYEFKEELKSKYEKSFENDFNNLNKKLTMATEISVIRGVSDEASNLREKCLSKINHFKKSKESQITPVPPKPTTKSVNVPIKGITHQSKVKIKNDEDLENLFSKIRVEVKKQLENNDIVNLEF